MARRCASESRKPISHGPFPGPHVRMPVYTNNELLRIGAIRCHGTSLSSGRKDPGVPSNEKGGRPKLLTLGLQAVFADGRLDYILTNASLGALHTGQLQSSGRSSNLVPSFASSYTYPHMVHLHIGTSPLAMRPCICRFDHSTFCSRAAYPFDSGPQRSGCSPPNFL